MLSAQVSGRSRVIYLNQRPRHGTGHAHWSDWKVRRAFFWRHGSCNDTCIFWILPCAFHQESRLQSISLILSSVLHQESRLKYIFCIHILPSAKSIKIYCCRSKYTTCTLKRFQMSVNLLVAVGSRVQQHLCYIVYTANGEKSIIECELIYIQYPLFTNVYCLGHYALLYWS